MAAKKANGSKAGNRSKARSPLALRGEKSVRGTPKEVAVKPARASKVEREPMDPAAVDRRRQVLDNEPGASRKRSGAAARSSSSSSGPTRGRIS